MGRILVIAEKPQMGRDIARVLNCTKKGNGYMIGDSYVVTWSFGHLVTLCEAQDYDPSYKKWKEETLPIVPKQMQIKLIDNDGNKNQFYIIKSLMNDPSIDELICATDAGREGELIFRYIYKMAGCTKKFKRLWVSSLTDEAILDGFRRLRSGEEYNNLYFSALSRSYADWLVGINSSRAYSIKYGAKLTIGRVQTPTLAFIVERQKEIDSFKSKDFWEIQAFYNKDFSGYWINKETKESKLREKEAADRIAAKVRGKDGVITDIEEDIEKESPPLLYDLTELQRDANRKFGFTTQETLEIAQKLYEQRKYITYPRTDSKYLTTDITSSLEQRIRSVQTGPYVKMAGQILNNSQLQITPRIIDNEKVNDHHAIIPTGAKVNIESLTEDEEKVYGLIVRRFLAVFYPKYEYLVKTVTVECENEIFISKGRTVINLGWMECYREASADDEDEEKAKKTIIRNQELPELTIGDMLKITEVKVHYNKTRPPSPYTEGTLLSAMEFVGRFVENADLKEFLKKTKGLGTPATRGAIIEKLIDTGYIKRRDKYLLPTKKGINLIDVVHDELKSPEMTGQWEKALENIVDGTMTMSSFMNCIVDFLKETIEVVKYSSKMDVGFEAEKPVYRR